MPNFLLPPPHRNLTLPPTLRYDKLFQLIEEIIFHLIHQFVPGALRSSAGESALQETQSPQGAQWQGGDASALQINNG